MSSYRLLDAWAERDQRRFEVRQTKPARAPGTEGRPFRVLQASLAMFTMSLKFVAIPALLVYAIQLIAHHTVRSLLLGLALLLLDSMSMFTMGAVIETRKEHGRNWFTGLTPRRR